MKNSRLQDGCLRSIWQGLLVGLCAVMTSSASGCAFPEFMTRASHWELNVTSERRSIGAMLRFPTANQAQLTDLKSGASTTFTCRTAVDHEIFLTSVTPSSSYQCLRFIRRSDFVVQLARSGVFSSASEEQCLNSSHFVLEESVMVTPRQPGSISSSPISCGLVGGYWLSVTDSSSHTCRDSFLRPIIESDCGAPGEGVLIDFRQQTCAVRSMSTRQRLHCLGSWTQSGFNFSVLSDDAAWPKMWMLRMPEVASETMTAHLVKSLSTKRGNSTADQYTVSLTRASVPTVCEDESSGCKVTHCADETAEVHCQKTCSACAATANGSSCGFDDQDVGQWLDVSRSAADDATKVLVVGVWFCNLTK